MSDKTSVLRLVEKLHGEQVDERSRQAMSGRPPMPDRPTWSGLKAIAEEIDRRLDSTRQEET